MTPTGFTDIFAHSMRQNLCLIAHLELTHACNLRCRHCYCVPDADRPECSFGEIRSVLRQLKEAGTLFLCLSGGELLCRADIFEILSCARAEGFALRLMTNGTLIDETAAARIAAAAAVTVDMSIYAANPRLHDAVTGKPGSLHLTLQAAALLRERGIRVVFKFIVMKDTVGEFKNIRALCQERGIDFIYDVCLVERTDGDARPLQYRLDKEGIKSFLRRNALSPAASPDGSVLCTAGLNNIFISPQLDVYPCIGIREKIGSLRQGSLKDIWESAPLLRRLRTLTDAELNACSSCAKRAYCFRCAGLALEASNDLCARSPFDCEVAQALAETAQREKETVL